MSNSGNFIVAFLCGAVIFALVSGILGSLHSYRVMWFSASLTSAVVATVLVKRDRERR